MDGKWLKWDKNIIQKQQLLFLSTDATNIMHIWVTLPSKQN